MWLRKDLLLKLNSKKEIPSVQAGTWRECRNAVWMCSDRIRKDKAQMEWILAKDMKNNKE